MKSILICPAERPTLAFLAQSAPLVNIPSCGECLLGYWLEALALEKVREVLVLATDRPHQVRAFTADGARWGLQVRILPELQEPSCAEAAAKYLAGNAGLGSASKVVLMDHFPGRPESPLFGSYSDWYAGLIQWMPEAAKTARVGLREIRPGVWVGMRTQIAPTAELHAPCWIGDYSQVGEQATVGPGAVLEKCVMVEAAAEVSSSYVGPETYVGTLTKLNESIAWGNILINWRTGSCIQVPDAFLLSPLRPSVLSRRSRSRGWFARALDRIWRPSEA